MKLSQKIVITDKDICATVVNDRKCPLCGCERMCEITSMIDSFTQWICSICYSLVELQPKVGDSNDNR